MRISNIGTNNIYRQTRPAINYTKNSMQVSKNSHDTFSFTRRKTQCELGALSGYSYSSDSCYVDPKKVYETLSNIPDEYERKIALVKMLTPCVASRLEEKFNADSPQQIGTIFGRSTYALDFVTEGNYSYQIECKEELDKIMNVANSRDCTQEKIEEILIKMELSKQD